MTRLFRSLALSLALLGLLLFGLAVGAHAQSVPDHGIVVLPDDQYVSASCSPNQLKSMPQWVHDNKATRNIKGMFSLGDDVDTSNSTQWSCYTTNVLDNQESENPDVLYGSAGGNHDAEGDTLGATPDPGARLYTQFIANLLPYIQSQSGYQAAWAPGDGTVDPQVNYWMKYTVGPQVYGAIFLEFCPRAGAVSWANSIMQANSSVYFAVILHAGLLPTAVLGTGGSSGTSGCHATGPDGVGDPAAYGSADVWNALKGNKNWYLAVGGHYSGGAGDYTAHEVLIGDQGNHVTWIYDNHQYDANSVWMGIIQVQPSLHQLSFSDYNNYLGEEEGPPVYQFATEYDDLNPPTSSPNAGTGGAVGVGGAAGIN